jgi:hypothetical protein
MFGPTLSGYLADKLGWNVSWWVYALGPGCWSPSSACSGST